MPVFSQADPCGMNFWKKLRNSLERSESGGRERNMSRPLSPGVVLLVFVMETPLCWDIFHESENRPWSHFLLVIIFHGSSLFLYLQTSSGQTRFGALSKRILFTLYTIDYRGLNMVKQVT